MWSSEECPFPCLGFLLMSIPPGESDLIHGVGGAGYFEERRVWLGEGEVEKEAESKKRRSRQKAAWKKEFSIEVM